MQTYIDVTDMVDYASAPERVRELANRWYETRGKLNASELAELYAWVRETHATALVMARECGVLLPEGRALSYLARALGWTDKHACLCAFLAHDAKAFVAERA